MAASSSQLRSWWRDYKCHPSRMVEVALPRPNNGIELILVAKPAARVWAAFAQIMDSEHYYFDESAGGTYNCRPIAGTSRYSLHSYGIALDLNPHDNPQKRPLTYEYPSTFIKRVEGIRVNGKQAIAWGGRWVTVRPDAMHWQNNTSPVDCGGKLVWDTGQEDKPVATWKSKDGYTYTDVDDWGQFSDAIKWNINQGLMMGRRDTSKKTAVFDPNAALDRDEAASIFFRLAKDSPTFKKEIED